MPLPASRWIEAPASNSLIIRVFQDIKDLIFRDGDLLVCGCSVVVLGLWWTLSMMRCIVKREHDGEGEGGRQCDVGGSSIDGQGRHGRDYQAGEAVSIQCTIHSKLLLSPPSTHLYEREIRRSHGGLASRCCAAGVARRAGDCLDQRITLCYPARVSLVLDDSRQ